MRLCDSASCQSALSRFAQSLQTGFLGVLICVISGCAPQSTGKKQYLKECVLPEDQSMTMMGRWKSVPVPIALASDFDTAEVADIVKAANTWNEFYSSSLKTNVFDYGDPNQPNRVSAAGSSSICSQGILSGGQFSGYVGIYKTATWSYGDGVIAMTTTCPSNKSSSVWTNKMIFNGILEFNYKDFFVDGKRVPDLVSIATHELGHLLGLDHSCESDGGRGFPNCANAGAYSEAVLAPSFGFYGDGTGVKRSELNDNDQGRGNCLYKDLVETENDSG